MHRRQPDLLWSTKLAATCVAASVVLCACTTQKTTPPPTPTPSVKASTSASPKIDLTESGRARAAVSALSVAAHDNPIIRLTLNQQRATLTYVTDQKARTLQWLNGDISLFDSDVEYVQQASFNPADFALDDVVNLFEQAAALAESDSAQELQINEVNSGSVLMSVSTEPESSTVFFRPDGSLIRPLVFSLTQDLEEGLRDTLAGRESVAAIGYRPEIGLWADLAVDSGIIERRTRPPKLPPYSARHTTKEIPTTFLASELKPEVIADFLANLPDKLGKPSTTAVSFVIDCTPNTTEPLMHFEVGGTKFVTNLSGTEIKPK